MVRAWLGVGHSATKERSREVYAGTMIEFLGKADGCQSIMAFCEEIEPAPRFKWVDSYDECIGGFAGDGEGARCVADFLKTPTCCSSIPVAAGILQEPHHSAYWCRVTEMRSRNVPLGFWSAGWNGCWAWSHAGACTYTAEQTLTTTRNQAITTNKEVSRQLSFNESGSTH